LPSLEELYLQIFGDDDENGEPVDFGTSALRKLHWYGGAKEIAVLHSMPMVKVCMQRISVPVGFGNKWGLESLSIGSTASTRKHGQPLSLGITADVSLLDLLRYTQTLTSKYNKN